MKAKLFIASAAIASMLLTACSSGSKFSAENFNVTPTPLNYAAAVLNSGMSSAQKDLAKSLFVYNQCANAYF